MMYPPESLRRANGERTFFLQKITKSKFSNKENQMVKRCKDHYLIEMWNTIYGLTDSFFYRF